MVNRWNLTDDGWAAAERSARVWRPGRARDRSRPSAQTVVRAHLQPGEGYPQTRASAMEPTPPEDERPGSRPGSADSAQSVA
eukprot:COSAG06_NODE_19324_length_843_cov_3.579301_1_plen_81_part_10